MTRSALLSCAGNCQRIAGWAKTRTGVVLLMTEWGGGETKPTDEARADQDGANALGAPARLCFLTFRGMDRPVFQEHPAMKGAVHGPRNC